MLLRYRYKDYITNQIVFEDSFTEPTNPNIKPDSLVIVSKATSNTNTNTSVDVNIIGRSYSNITPNNFQLGSYTVKISKKIEQIGSPSAVFQVSKVDHADIALVHRIISSQSNGGNPEYFELIWLSNEGLKIRKDNPINSIINTYDGIYNVVIY